MTWPPTLDELKSDMKIELADTRDDEALQRVLDAAVSFVQRNRSGIRYDETDPDQLNYSVPDADLRLGTLRLAARWDARRRSQDGTIDMGDLGVTRVSTGDPDIDRMLRIGRHKKPSVG